MQSNIGDFGDDADESGETSESDTSGEDTPGVPGDYRHPSNVHTEYPDLDEIPDEVPIDAANADVERAGRIVRQLQQQPDLGHHSIISRRIVDYYRDSDDHPDAYYKMTVDAGPDIWNFGRIGSETLARAVETFAAEQYPDALEAATEQYNEELRQKCESALEEQETREADRRFQADPPEDVDGWVRFESEKPDVELAYRCEYRGTPAVAAVYRTDDGLDAHESTLDEWTKADTAADAKVNRHFMLVTKDRGAYGSLRAHLETFEDAAEPLEYDRGDHRSSDVKMCPGCGKVIPSGMFDYCSDCGDREEDADAPTFEDYDFSAGDHVAVDWSEGMGPVDEFTGTVEDITKSAGEVIVTVRCDEGTYEEGSIYGPKHDVAPEWIETNPAPDSNESDSDAQPVAADGGQVETIDEEPEVIGDSDDLPSNETVQILTGITRVMHTPRVVEGETSGTGKTISVELDTGESVRLDAREIFDGESEYRDSRYYELYTPGRLRTRQRSNKAPGPRAGTDSVTDSDDLPAPSHWPNVDEPDDAPEECPHCGQTSAPWEDVTEPRCFRCGELPSAAEEDDSDDSDEETPDKWGLSRLDRGDILSLEGYGDDYVVTRVHTYVGTQTVSKVEVATREAGEWTTYKLRKVDHLGNTCLNVDAEDETSVMINVDDPDHAQDFAVVGHDMDRLQAYIDESYYGD